MHLITMEVHFHVFHTSERDGGDVIFTIQTIYSLRKSPLNTSDVLLSPKAGSDVTMKGKLNTKHLPRSVLI